MSIKEEAKTILKCALIAIAIVVTVTVIVTAIHIGVKALHFFMSEIVAVCSTTLGIMI